MNGDLVNILGSVEVPIVIVDGARRIRRFTPKARPILNLLPSDVGRPIDDIKPTLAIRGFDQKIADVIDSVVAHEEEVQAPDGHWYRLQIRPYTTVDKRVDGAVVSIIDIDVLKRALGDAEWARDYARATVEAVQLPLIVLDKDLLALSANTAFYDRYRATSSGLEGRGLYEIMGGVWDIPQLRLALAKVQEMDSRFQSLQLERVLPKVGRRSLSISGRAVATPSGERLILLGIEDVTERVQREAERARLLEEARSATAEAEKANQAKDVFLATVSHELRTPLSTLLLNAQYLRGGKLDEARLRKTGESIERATRVQAQLINDLLDISRVATGKLKLEQEAVNLASVVKTTLDTAVVAANVKHLQLEVRLDESLPAVWGDPVRLQQVVWNLVNNAIKFTPEGGRLTVTLERADGRARLQVTDTGIGIEPEFLPHLFTRFTQEDRGHTRSHGGLGLGLAVVRHLVEAHEGTVEAMSAGRGQGATLTVVLPLMAGDVRAPAASGIEPVGGQALNGSIDGARILVVEDDPGTRDALEKMLSLGGARVHTAASAAEAMTVFVDFAPELLICDVAMPVEDGYSLIGRVRALGRARGGDVPALALTALAADDDKRRALEAGFQAHLAKPIDINQLVAALSVLRHDARAVDGAEHPSPGP